jgi:hypothetical protein
MFLSWHNLDFKTFENESAVAQVIAKETKESGYYILPEFAPQSYGEQSDHKKWEKNAAKGPFAFMSILPQGKKHSMKFSMLYQFLSLLIASFIASMLLIKSSRVTALEAAKFCSLMGVFGAVISGLPLWNWWEFPPTSTMVCIIDTGITWFLAGLAMGKVLHTQT